MKQDQVIDEETGLPVIIPGQVPNAPVDKNIDEVRERNRSRIKQMKQAPQPLATRHLDPNFNPALEGPGGEYVPKVRVKVRENFTFYIGDEGKLGYKGPVILYLTEEQMKGQEHKIEVLGNKAVSMLDTVPVGVKEDMTALDRAKEIEALKAKLETLEAEHNEYVKRTTEAADASSDTLSEPDFNPEAEAKETKPPAPGAISGPAVADDKKKQPGRPAGKVSKIKKG